MKKIIMSLAVVLAIGGAVATQFTSQAATVSAPVSLYDPNTCTTIECTSSALPKSCSDLRVNSCSGNFYTGNLKRNN